MEVSGRSAFGSLLRRFRLAAGFSQEALAERARMSVSTVGALERGARRAPYRESVALLADALALAPEDRARLEAAAARPRHPRLRALNAATQGALALEPRGEVVAFHAVEPPQHNLPAQVSTLIGRDEVVAEVGALVRAHRLVTLLGSGGVGKTRVALQVAKSQLGDWRDGVWLVQFAPLGDPLLVAPAVAAALGVNASGGQSVVEQVVATLRRRRLLLVLDNCEHVIGEAAIVAETILHACAEVHVLATSRERLNLDGERVYRVPSLAVPPEAEPLTRDEILRYGAVELFADRAQAAESRFEVGDETAPLVARICRRLDGIPLAIELTAARANMLSLNELARRLDDEFSLLAGGRRTALPRQQTMHATIEWSFELLTGAEQTLFRRLGILAGGWTLEAAEGVCGSGRIDERSVLDLLCGLVEKSLVVADSSGAETRYSLLESTRAFALDKLEASGERTCCARRHAEWFAGFFEREGDARRRGGRESSDLMRFLRFGVDNGRAALVWAMDTPADPVLGGRLTCALFDWDVLQYPTGGHRRTIEAVLTQLDGLEHLGLQAKLWRRLGNVDTLMGKRDGRREVECLRHAISLCERAGDRTELAQCLLDLARLRVFCLYQFAEAESAVDEALAILHEERMERTSLYADAMGHRGIVLLNLGRLDEARTLLVDAIGFLKAIGDDARAGEHRVFLADLEFIAGDAQRAVRLLDESIADARLRNMGIDLAVATMCRAACRLALGQFGDSFGDSREALLYFRHWRCVIQIPITIQNLAELAALVGHVRSGARLLGYVDARYEALGFRREPALQVWYETLRAALRERLTDAEIGALGAEGAELDEDSAADEALAIESLFSKPTEAAARTTDRLP
jgi:predicted ATPase/transcriptional regulator with XRE-family HTH domain/tetratricopeptide (TPR) repeat protein